MTSMNTALPIAVLGGDARQISAASALDAHGMRVLAWGMGEERQLPVSVRCCRDWREATEAARVLLLPLPVSHDGVHLNCPLTSGEEAVRLDLIFGCARGRLILGGRFPEPLLRRAEGLGVRCVDYFDSEILQLKNALPTAEGAIEIAMRELPVTLDGAHAAVIGYGRIGALLSQKLLALGARVTVYARRPEVLTEAVLHHCDAISLTVGAEAVLSRISRDVRVIFNTVPSPLFSEAVIKGIPKGCVFIDLASAPGGIDRIAAEREGVRCIWATALPGKYAPETAGQIIADTARHILCAEGLL